MENLHCVVDLAERHEDNARDNLLRRVCNSLARLDPAVHLVDGVLLLCLVARSALEHGERAHSRDAGVLALVALCLGKHKPVVALAHIRAVQVHVTVNRSRRCSPQNTSTKL